MKEKTVEKLEIGDEILVLAQVWTGYLDGIPPEEREGRVYLAPERGREQDKRCLLRRGYGDKVPAGVFVGWGYLKVGNRERGRRISSMWGDEFEGPVFHLTDNVKVARWVPKGTQYRKPLAALPGDIEIPGQEER